MDGPFNYQLNSYRRCQVDDDISLRSKSIKDDLVRNGGVGEVETRMLEKLGDVLDLPSRQIVYHENSLSGRKEHVGQVRPNKASATSN